MTQSANAKNTYTETQVKTFNKQIAHIKTSSEALAVSIHSAGIFAIAQANEFGNINFGTRLMDAMGKKHNRQRVVNWLVKFGKFGVAKGLIVYRNRKDISAENLDKWLDNANKTPYWELTPEAKLIEKIDYLTMLGSLLNRHKAAQNKAEFGIKIEEHNIGIIPELQKLFDKFQTPHKPKANKVQAEVAMQQG